MSWQGNSAGKVLTTHSGCLPSIPETHRVERENRLAQTGPVATIHSLSHKNKCNKNISGEILTYVTLKRNPENRMQGKIHELQRTSIRNQNKQMQRPSTVNNSTQGGSWDGGREGWRVIKSASARGFPFKTMKKLGEHSGTGCTMNCLYLIVGDTKVLVPTDQ